MVLRPAKPLRARGLHEMKTGIAAGEGKKERTRPKARSITAEPLSWDWAKPSRLRRQKEDLQLLPGHCKHQSCVLANTYIVNLIVPPAACY